MNDYCFRITAELKITNDNYTCLVLESTPSQRSRQSIVAFKSLNYHRKSQFTSVRQGNVSKPLICSRSSTCGRTATSRSANVTTRWLGVCTQAKVTISNPPGSASVAPKIKHTSQVRVLSVQTFRIPWLGHRRITIKKKKRNPNARVYAYIVVVQEARRRDRQRRKSPGAR